MPAAPRLARFSLEKSGKLSTLTVSVPTKIKENEFVAIQKSVLDRVGKLTGHRGCLSGGVKVIYEEDFSDIMHF